MMNMQMLMSGGTFWPSSRFSVPLTERGEQRRKGNPVRYVLQVAEAVAESLCGEADPLRPHHALLPPREAVEGDDVPLHTHTDPSPPFGTQAPWSKSKEEGIYGENGVVRPDFAHFHPPRR